MAVWVAILRDFITIIGLNTSFGALREYQVVTVSRQLPSVFCQWAL